MDVVRLHHSICLNRTHDDHVCGTQNPPGAKVCINPECRTRFNVCKRCKTLNRFGARFCRTCDAPLPVLGDLEWRALGGGMGHLGCTDDPVDFPLAVQWRWPANPARRTRRFVASPVVYKGLLYAAGLDGSVIALDQYSGEVRGETGAGSPISATPTITETELWLVTRAGDLCVMDSRVGGQAQESQRLSAEPLSGCAVFEDLVVAAAAEGRITAVERRSIAHVLWQWPRDGSCLPGGLEGGIAATGDTILAVSGHGRVLALSRSGDVLWEEDAFDKPATVTAPPAADEKCVYVCERGGQCAALRTSDGVRMWHDVRVAGPVLAGLAVGNGAVFAASGRGVVSELDAQTGGCRRDIDLNDERRPCWCARHFTGCAAPPTCTPSYVLFGTDSWRVYAWRRGTSRVARVVDTDGPVFSAPAVSDGRIYVTTWDGSIWALGSPED